MCATFEIRIVKGVVSKDHVHILVSAPPNMAPGEIMRRIKGNTASRRDIGGDIFGRVDIFAPQWDR